jgi:hypothetical protein
MTTGHYTTYPSTRGFGPKLSLIVERLNAKGIPPNLRPVELRRWIWAEATELGYASSRGEMPSRATIDRSVLRL